MRKTVFTVFGLLALTASTALIGCRPKDAAQDGGPLDGVLRWNLPLHRPRSLHGEAYFGPRGRDGRTGRQRRTLFESHAPLQQGAAFGHSRSRSQGNPPQEADHTPGRRAFTHRSPRGMPFRRPLPPGRKSSPTAAAATTWPASTFSLGFLNKKKLVEEPGLVCSLLCLKT